MLLIKKGIKIYSLIKRKVLNNTKKDVIIKCKAKAFFNERSIDKGGIQV